MTQPRGAMTEALRDAFANAVQQADPPQQEIAESVEPEPVEQPDEVVAESVAETPQEPSDADGEIQSINDLPDAMGWDAEAFYSLPIRLADDEDPVPLGQVKDRLQQISKEQRELAQQRAAIEETQQQLQQAALTQQQGQSVRTDRIAKAEGILTMIEQQYPALEKDWAAREEVEPGKVALERQRVGQQAAIAQGELQQARAEAQAQQTQALSQWQMQQHQVLASQIPEWQQDDKRQQMQQEIARFAIKHYGVRPEQLSRIDASTILMLRDAMAGVKSRQQAEQVVAKIKASPKAVPKGLRMARSKSSEADVAQSIERARSTRSKRDNIDAIKAVLASHLNT